MSVSLTVVALLAIPVPARHATKVDPLVTFATNRNSGSEIGLPVEKCEPVVKTNTWLSPTEQGRVMKALFQ